MPRSFLVKKSGCNANHQRFHSDRDELCKYGDTEINFPYALRATRMEWAMTSPEVMSRWPPLRHHSLDAARIELDISDQSKYRFANSFKTHS